MRGKNLNFSSFSFVITILFVSAMELLDQFECSAERAGDAAEVMFDVVANLALPENQPSLGGGQSNNNLPKKKDEEWYWWKGGRDYQVGCQGTGK